MKKLYLKKIFLLLSIPSSLCLGVSQFNQDFVHRFGPDSHIYNTPLYFATIRRTATENGDKKNARKVRKSRSCTAKRCAKKGYTI